MKTSGDPWKVVYHMLQCLMQVCNVSRIKSMYYVPTHHGMEITIINICQNINPSIPVIITLISLHYDHGNNEGCIISDPEYSRKVAVLIDFWCLLQ